MPRRRPVRYTRPEYAEPVHARRSRRSESAAPPCTLGRGGARRLLVVRSVSRSASCCVSCPAWSGMFGALWLVFVVSRLAGLQLHHPVPLAGQPGAVEGAQSSGCHVPADGTYARWCSSSRWRVLRRTSSPGSSPPLPQPRSWRRHSAALARRIRPSPCTWPMPSPARRPPIRSNFPTTIPPTTGSSGPSHWSMPGSAVRPGIAICCSSTMAGNCRSTTPMIPSPTQTGRLTAFAASSSTAAGSFCAR